MHIYGPRAMRRAEGRVPGQGPSDGPRAEYRAKGRVTGRGPSTGPRAIYRFILVARAGMPVAAANSPWSWQTASSKQLASVGESQG